MVGENNSQIVISSRKDLLDIQKEVGKGFLSDR